jgi:hypothetical protein
MMTKHASKWFYSREIEEYRKDRQFSGIINENVKKIRNYSSQIRGVSKFKIKEKDS